VFAKLRMTDQIKGLFLGLFSIRTDFAKLSEEIKEKDEYQALSLDWSMVSNDMKIAMSKYKERINEESSKS
jgi:hypothetical protein